MRIIAAVVLAGGLAAAAVAVAAQGAAPASEDGRFSFKDVPEGLLRLDGRTGQVSICTRRDAGWACQAVPDDRAVLEGEISRLQAENAALRKDLAARAAPPSGPGVVPDPPGRRDLSLPSDAEVDRMMSILERMWRRLIDMAQRTERGLDRPNLHRQRFDDERI